MLPKLIRCSDNCKDLIKESKEQEREGYHCIVYNIHVHPITGRLIKKEVYITEKCSKCKEIKVK